jgi:hypothetical protein
MGPGAVRIGWTAAWDRDNAHLKFEGCAARPRRLRPSSTRPTPTARWWNRPPLGFLDTTAPPCSSQTYRIRATDLFGTSLVSASTTVTIPDGSAPPSPYAAAVLADSPSWEWRMGEASGTTAYDQAGSNDAILNTSTGGGRGAPGALIGDADTATDFGGTGSTGTVLMISPFRRRACRRSRSRVAQDVDDDGRQDHRFLTENNAGASQRQRPQLYMSNGQIYFGTA